MSSDDASSRPQSPALTLQLLPKYVLVIVCCVCKRYITYREQSQTTGLSHGYCASCYQDALGALRLQAGQESAGS